MSSDENSSRPASWQRLAQTWRAGQRGDIASQIGRELRAVFSLAKIPRAPDRVHHLLDEIEARRAKK